MPTPQAEKRVVSTPEPAEDQDRAEFEQWWTAMGRCLGLSDRVQSFFAHARAQNDILERLK